MPHSATFGRRSDFGGPGCCQAKSRHDKPVDRLVSRGGFPLHAGLAPYRRGVRWGFTLVAYHGVSCRSRRRTSRRRGGTSRLLVYCSRVRALCYPGRCGYACGRVGRGRRCGGSPADQKSFCSSCFYGASWGRGGGASAAPPYGRTTRTLHPSRRWCCSPKHFIAASVCGG